MGLLADESSAIRTAHVIVVIAIVRISLPRNERREPRAGGWCVQFKSRNPDDTLTLWGYPLWVKITEWENFTTRSFTGTLVATTIAPADTVPRRVVTFASSPPSI